MDSEAYSESLQFQAVKKGRLHLVVLELKFPVRTVKISQKVKQSNLISHLI